MNLLEINVSKLCEILGTHPENGLTSEDVERNRREFSTPSPKKGIRFTAKSFSGI